MDYNSSSRKLIEQLSNGIRNLTCIWDEYRPLKSSPIFSCANLPGLQLCGGHPSNLNQGPMAGEGQRRFAIRQRAAHDKMIASVDQDANHGFQPPSRGSGTARPTAK